MIDAWRVTLLRVRNEHSDHANHFLHRAVRVIEKSSFLVNGKFIPVGFAGRDWLLADVRYAVLFDGNFQSVPMHGGAFRQAIFHVDAHPVSLLHLNGGSGATAVVAPHIERFPRHDAALYRLGNQSKYFGAAIHREGQIRDVW